MTATGFAMLIVGLVVLLYLALNDSKLESQLSDNILGWSVGLILIGSLLMFSGITTWLWRNAP